MSIYHENAFKGHLYYPMWSVYADGELISYGQVSFIEAKEIAMNFLMDFPDVDIKLDSNYNEQVYKFDKKKGFIEITEELWVNIIMEYK